MSQHVKEMVMTEDRILLVDDDKHLLRAMHRVFKKRFTVETALCGDVALSKIKENGLYAVIICDLKMPRMDGLEFIKQAKEISPNSMYMMLSGHASLEIAVEALNQGLIYKFFSKPTEQDELAKAIEEALQEYHINIAKSEYLNLSSTKSLSSSIEQNISEKLENDLQIVQRTAAQKLVEVQDSCSLLMTPLLLKTGKKSNCVLTSFDQATLKKIKNIKRILGTAPETIAKIDILKLGTVASYIYKNIEQTAGNKFLIDIHFSTLYHRRFLEMYLRICRSLIDTVRGSISFKITNIPNDILPTRATDLISRIRPFATDIFVEIPELDNCDRFVQGLSKVVLAFNYKDVVNDKTSAAVKRKLVNTLAHTSNKTFFADCELENGSEISKVFNLDFYVPVS